MFDAELSQIKTLSLEGYALSMGYERDTKESGASVAVLRRPADNGKLLVKVGHDGHWVFRDERDYRNHGTILDFAMCELGVNLGEARKALRAWANLPLHPAQIPKHLPGSDGVGQTGQTQNVPECPPDDEPDRARMAAIWKAATRVPEHPYLISRHIPKTVLQDGRFKDCWRLDRHGNAVFPFWDKQAICGLEFRSATKKHFAKGGRKGLWCSKNLKTCLRMVVTEAPVDALSHLALYQDATDHVYPLGYACPGGSLGERSKALLVHLFTEAAKRGAEILIGTDNDPAGDEYAKALAALAGQARREVPVGNDWNDDLAFIAKEGGPWN